MQQALVKDVTTRRNCYNALPVWFNGGPERMKAEKISELTTNRLSLYLRCLNILAAAGRATVSSQDLAKEFGLNSAQIRKDLAYFGEFGVRGVGYAVDDLRRHLTKILGLDVTHRVGIIGAGNLGQALAHYKGFAQAGFTIVALFDNDRHKLLTESSLPVYPVREFARVAREQNLDVAVIAVPARAAQGVLNRITAAGVKAVLNFAPTPLKTTNGVKVKTVDLTVSLESLSYFLAQPNNQPIAE
jgi:redox-sensing transcriptional repressor